MNADPAQINLFLKELYDLRGKSDGASTRKRKEIRLLLHNVGILSLPFSMNPKRKSEFKARE